MQLKGFRGSVFGLTVLVFVGLTFLTASQAYAQVSGATLSGTVTDSSGAVIPNAQVAITDVATSVTRTVSTGDAGLYTAPNLLPGSYEIRVTAMGFSTQVRKGITLTVGAQQALDIKMQVGQVSQTVEVTTEAPTVELTSSTLNAVVNATTVRELPLNGRSWTDLATLQPGVNAILAQPSFATGGDRGNRGFGSEITISGVRPQYNNYRMDGISLNDYSNGAPGSVLGGNLGVDAIQEFSVLTGNYSAEYGKTAGGVVNAISRSGTNQFHGSVYEFLRNNALDAKNYFDSKSQPIPPFRRNQFGGSAGGPIIKDRTFIFGDFEAIRQSKGITNTSFVPSDAARAGNLTSGPITVDPGVAKYLALYPHANGTVNGNTGIFSFAGQQVVNEYFVTSRVDHKFSDKDSVFGTYLYDDTDYRSPDRFDVQLIGSHTKRQVVVLEENHVFSPTVVNTIRVGYSREHAANNQSAAAINPLAADPSLGAVPGLNAADMRIVGIDEMLGGLNSLTTNIYDWNSYQVYDDAFVSRGKHTFKFGFAAERIQENVLPRSNPGGIWNFNSLSDFLTNKPLNFTSGFANTISSRGWRQTVFGAYIQDDWRVRHNLTVNLGLRYEPTTVMTENHGKITTLINLTDAAPHLGDPLFENPTLRNFAPRVGFSWDPFGNGKTAVRGGFGVFDVLPLPYQFVLAENTAAPFFLMGSVSDSSTSPLAGTFFTGGYPLLTSTTFLTAYIQPNPRRDYLMQWNLNVQRQLTPNLTAMIGYIGSHGVHQPFRTDEFDNVTPQRTSAGYLVPVNGTSLNPNFGTIQGVVYNNTSSFHALEVGIQRSMSHGLRAQGSFTWGKSLDDNSATVAGDQFSNTLNALWNYFDTRATRGLSDFDVARTLVLNVTWDVPGPKMAWGPVGWITNGWELGGIYTASDGIPFTATIGGGALGLKGRKPVDFPNRLSGSGCSTLVNPGSLSYVKKQCFALPTAPDMAFYNANCKKVGAQKGLPFPTCLNLIGQGGRNTLIGPALSNLDFSLFKNNRIRRISESFNIQFRAEYFNVLNHPNFLPPTTNNSSMFDASGNLVGSAGILTATSNTSREIQFALKFVW